MFNVVTGPINTPHAVLIRAIEPTIGTDHLLDRRSIKLSSPIMFQGPGKVGQALGCTIDQSGSMMNQTDSIYAIIHEPTAPTDFQVIVGPRVGID